MKRFLCLLILSIGVAGCFAPPHPVTPPTPPAPTPDVVVPATGIRVLIVFESSENYSRETLNILNSTAIISKLNDICTKSADGRPEWRKWDQTTIEATGLENESEIWRDLWADTKPKLGTLPVIVAVTDQKAVVHQLPATEAGTLKLLDQIVEGK